MVYCIVYSKSEVVECIDLDSFNKTTQKYYANSFDWMKFHKKQTVFRLVNVTLPTID
jgi:hypothetical protein